MADYYDKHNSSYEGIQERRPKLNKEIICPYCGNKIRGLPKTIYYSEKEDLFIVEGLTCKKCKNDIPLSATTNTLRREIIQVRDLKEDYFYAIKIKRHEFDFYLSANRPVPAFIKDRYHKRIHKAYRAYIVRNKQLKEDLKACMKNYK